MRRLRRPHDDYGFLTGVFLWGVWYLRSDDGEVVCLFEGVFPEALVSVLALSVPAAGGATGFLS